MPYYNLYSDRVREVDGWTPSASEDPYEDFNVSHLLPSKARAITLGYTGVAAPGCNTYTVSTRDNGPYSDNCEDFGEIYYPKMVEFKCAQEESWSQGTPTGGSSAYETGRYMYLDNLKVIPYPDKTIYDIVGPGIISGIWLDVVFYRRCDPPDAIYRPAIQFHLNKSLVGSQEAFAVNPRMFGSNYIECEYEPGGASGYSGYMSWQLLTSRPSSMQQESEWGLSKDQLTTEYFSDALFGLRFCCTETLTDVQTATWGGFRITLLVTPVIMGSTRTTLITPERASSIITPERDAKIVSEERSAKIITSEREARLITPIRTGTIGA